MKADIIAKCSGQKRPRYLRECVTVYFQLVDAAQLLQFCTLTLGLEEGFTRFNCEGLTMGNPELTLYELAAADPAIRFSPHCWKSRLALARKGLVVKRVPWHFTEKEAIAFSGHSTVPILIDGDRIVGDSWQIALHLEKNYPGRPSIFGGEFAIPLTRFINSWSDSTLLPALGRILAPDIFSHIRDADKDYFRTSREQRFGDTLDGLRTNRSAHLTNFRECLKPLRLLLKEQPFISGNEAAYADCCPFGMFLWARCISSVEILDMDDPVFSWRERMLDAFGGLGRSADSVAK